MRRKTWALAGAIVLVAAAVIGGVVAASGGGHAPEAAQAALVNTATVDRGNLADMVSQYGILTYQAQSDGSPYAVINRVGGTYTELPTAGDKVVCGGVLYRVNNRPVLLLCGSTPAYRSLSEGDQQAIPVDGGKSEAKQIKNAAQHQPARMQRPLPELRPAQVAHKLPPDRNQDGEGKQRLQQRPPLPQPCAHRLCIVLRPPLVRLPHALIRCTMAPRFRVTWTVGFLGR